VKHAFAMPWQIWILTGSARLCRLATPVLTPRENSRDFLVWPGQTLFCQLSRVPLELPDHSRPWAGSSCSAHPEYMILFPDSFCAESPTAKTGRLGPVGSRFVCRPGSTYPGLPRKPASGADEKAQIPLLQNNQFRGLSVNGFKTISVNYSQ